MKIQHNSLSVLGSSFSVLESIDLNLQYCSLLKIRRAKFRLQLLFQCPRYIFSQHSTCSASMYIIIFLNGKVGIFGTKCIWGFKFYISFSGCSVH